MAKREGPTIIRKYANRRLYNTGTSTYVTLEDLAAMVKAGDTFVAVDARTDAEITQQVLLQIIVELEARGPALLSAAFLSQLVRFHGTGLEATVPPFLEKAIEALAAEETRLGAAEPASDAWIRRAIAAFDAAARGPAEDEAASTGGTPSAPARHSGHSGEFDVLKAELEAMRQRLDLIAGDRSDDRS